MGRERDAALLTELLEQAHEIVERITESPEDVPTGAWPAGGFDSVYRARRLRDRVFGQTGLFGEPGWDILVALARAEDARKQCSVTTVCIDSCVAPTTALRYISMLEEAGLLERRRDPSDQRRTFVSLTEKARCQLREYVGLVEAVKTSGS